MIWSNCRDQRLLLNEINEIVDELSSSTPHVSQYAHSEMKPSMFIHIQIKFKGYIQELRVSLNSTNPPTHIIKSSPHDEGVARSHPSVMSMSVASRPPPMLSQEPPPQTSSRSCLGSRRRRRLCPGRHSHIHSLIHRLLLPDGARHRRHLLTTCARRHNWRGLVVVSWLWSGDGGGRQVLNR